MNSVTPAQVDRGEARIKRGEICILMATRGRPDMLAEELASLASNTSRKDLLKVWLYVDDDDKITRQAIDGGRFPDPGYEVNWFIGPRTPGLGECHVALLKASGRTAEIYMISCDDARFDTPAWDEAVRAKFAEYPDGVLLTFADDPNATDRATYPFIGWKWVETLGYAFPGLFPYWWEDTWIDEIGRMAGRCAKVSILIGPIGGGKGKTQRMRCVPFWTRYFQLTQFERKEEARKLISVMHPTDEKARAAALAQMEVAYSSLKKITEDSFSEVYCVFQEERHSALTLEERNRFSPLYLRQEMVAVIRLLTIAQSHLDKKDYAEALKYVEATQLADMRVRAAHDMKIRCLRELGRNAEADQLAREAALSWPQMSVTRRWFRFLGMVANEARNVIGGFSTKAKKGVAAPAPAAK
jgi:hypothetical protein